MTPAALAALHAEAFGAAPRPWTEGEFASLLAAPGVFLRAVPDGFALGRALAPAPGGEAELLTLAVRPRARRRGAGTALLRAFEGEARARGAAEAFLEVSARNGPARALYSRAGWTAAGRRPGYYADGSDALVLRRGLDAVSTGLSP
ncbi:ribosomal-protein-alanine N-acetyltransferase [Hasllibacter halocynthiae]|uniref:Ribosomal-protein-alanine N-acetyltransferase n=1 Tax=Hasllibacter halocynthiae TaxID=595589 RepID=A0A2T0X323_9RHOB|nr:GNAT family N-acetyltransferase [Hasllibacter halocynthiae]PRY93331.1 ribosomal-protein-alanine N-acetyltransferase [Hasllibacter halocynthiae]